MAQNELKKLAAEAALKLVEDDMVIGIGTGSTVDFFIEALASVKHRIEGVVASSTASAQKLQANGIRVLDVAAAGDLPLYVDGADECNPQLQLIKGGGGALTGEKIIAEIATTFVCIADESKQVDVLGAFPLAVEVLPMARSYVARELVKLGGSPVYREHFVSDFGNIILDVHNLPILEPLALDVKLNQITGVVCHGLFAARPADKAIIAGSSGVRTVTAT